MWARVRRQHKADAEENKTRQCLQNSLAKQSASSVSGSCRQTRLWHAEEDVKRLSEETYHLVSKRFDISLQEWEALETAKTSLEAETKQLMANLQDKEKVVILLRVFVSTMHYSHSDLAPPPPTPSTTPDSRPSLHLPSPSCGCMWRAGIPEKWFMFRTAKPGGKKTLWVYFVCEEVRVHLLTNKIDSQGFVRKERMGMWFRDARLQVCLYP